MLLNSSLSRAGLYAGIIPAAAHWLECRIIHLMNALAACCELGSGSRWASITSWWELAQEAGLAKIVGIGTSDHFKFGAVDLRSLICQMPSHVTDVSPFLKARYCESSAPLGGLMPFFTWSTIQVSAATPAGLLYVALVPSAEYGSPPPCQSRLRNMRYA